MNNNVSYEDVVNKKVNKLVLDCIYENKKPNVNMSCRVLPKLMNVQNSGGFRVIGQYKNNFDVDDGLWIGAGVSQQFVIKLSVQLAKLSNIDNYI